MKKDLDLMLEDMQSSPREFRPTQFWVNASKPIVNELKTDTDFDNFRRLPSSRKMFVPSYENYFYRNNRRLFNNLLNVPFKRSFFNAISNSLTGLDKAKNDYRLFLATSSNKFPDLTTVEESMIGNPIETFTFDNKKYNQGFLNYLRGINFLKNNVDCTKIKKVIEIGGGFGSMGEIVQKSIPGSFYLNVDIPPVSAVSTYYLSTLFGKDKVLTYEDSRKMETIDIDEISKQYKCMVICPWQLPKLKGKFDLFVNFISFQEMEPENVKNYVSIIQEHVDKFVLLRNSKYGKKLAKKKNDVGVLDPVKLDFIIDSFTNFELVNRDYKLYGEYHNGFASEVALLKTKNQ